MKTIAVDLDGVLAEYTGWKGATVFGEPLPGAQQFIKHLLDAGFDVVVHTARVRDAEDRNWAYIRNRLGAWLESNGFDHRTRIWDELGKPIAVAYVDDRAVAVKSNAPDFSEAALRIHELAQEHKS